MTRPRFEDVQTGQQDGWSRAVASDGALMVQGGRAFIRNGIKNVLGSEKEHVRWLVGELNGVRVYWNGDAVVMTTEDLYP